MRRAVARRGAQDGMDKTISRLKVGETIRRARESAGLSRRQLAERLNVDLSAVAGWEGGKHRPRLAHAVGLSAELRIDIQQVLEQGPSAGLPAPAARLVDTLEDLPDLLVRVLDRTKRSLRAFRLAAPYPTIAHVQTEFRKKVAERILAGSLEVHRAEIFYDLRRLKDVLSNIFRYDGRPYWVKSYCAGMPDVAPAVGGYIFDDDRILIGAYWTGVPPHGRPGLDLSGEPFATYFDAYWREVWGRGEFINGRGSHDLSQVRDIALKLGLPPEAWPAFVEEARLLEIGDGAPPLV